MTIVGSATSDREFVEAVARVLLTIGEAEVSTLLNPTRRVSVAMDAVRDARDHVYYHTKWKFRRKEAQIALVANQMWYDLPNDYEDIASGVRLNRQELPLQFLNHDNLILMYPDLRVFPPGSGVGDITTAGQAAAQTHNYGESKYFTVAQQYIGLVPIPNAAFVSLEHIVFYTYWAQAPMLVTDNDSLGIPRELWNAAHLIAVSNMKQALGFDGWENLLTVGATELRRQTNAVHESVDQSKYQHDYINYNE